MFQTLGSYLEWSSGDGVVVHHFPIDVGDPSGHRGVRAENQSSCGFFHRLAVYLLQHWWITIFGDNCEFGIFFGVGVVVISLAVALSDVLVATRVQQWSKIIFWEVHGSYCFYLSIVDDMLILVDDIFSEVINPSLL